VPAWRITFSATITETASTTTSGSSRPAATRCGCSAPAPQQSIRDARECRFARVATADSNRPSLSLLPRCSSAARAATGGGPPWPSGSPAMGNDQRLHRCSSLRGTRASALRARRVARGVRRHRRHVCSRSACSSAAPCTPTPTRRSTSRMATPRSGSETGRSRSSPGASFRPAGGAPTPSGTQATDRRAGSSSSRP
jgi:hypothetical protein